MVNKSNFYEVRVDYKAESSSVSEAKNLHFGSAVYYTVGKTKIEARRNLKPIIDAHERHLNRFEDLRNQKTELDIHELGKVTS